MGELRSLEMPFSVGDRVRLNKNSQYYGESMSNPADVVGTVTGINTVDPYTIRVHWGDMYDNVYRPYDLEHEEGILWES